MKRLITMGLSGLLALGLSAIIQDPPPREGPPPPAEKARGKPRGPEHDLRKAYDLLVRLRAEEETGGRPDRRLRDWLERSSDLYRRAISAERGDDPRLVHEYAAASHDLARAVDHARKAELSDRRDDDLPPPPEPPGPEDAQDRAKRDLRHAFDRIQELDPAAAPEGNFYRDAARDLYNAARRDVREGRIERGGELARAAEALTHVPEHLGHALEDAPKPPPRPEGEPSPRPRPRPEGGRPVPPEDLPPEIPA